MSRNLLRQFLEEETAATMIEYALMVVLIAIVMIATVILMTTSLDTTFQNIKNELDNVNT